MTNATPDGPPALSLLAGEGLAGLELVRLAARQRALRAAPHGAGEAVMTVPGLGADDWSMLALRRYLERHGLTVWGWGQGVNQGVVRSDLDRVTDRVATLAAETDQKVHLVGWSAGGILSREIGRARPDLVAQVISFGSPVVGGPLHTNTGRRFDAEQIALILERIKVREQTPITVPVTAMYSKRDGVVDWRACIDNRTAGAENIEVSSTHLGMGHDPDVWLEVIGRITRRGVEPRG